MGQPSLDAAVARIAAIEEYQLAFRRVFGRPPTGPDLVRAIASYERTRLSFDSPFDHFIAGDRNAIDDEAKRGWEIFNTRGRCNKCHALTLWDVSGHYNKGDGLQNPYLDEDMQPLALREGDIDDLVAFLASLTSADYEELGVRELARQRELSRTHRPQRDTARAFGPKPPRPKPPRP